MDKFLRLSLMFFSADGAGAGSGTPGEGQNSAEDSAGEAGTEKAGKSTGNENGGAAGNSGANGAGSENEPLTLDAVQKLIQSETDKVRTEYSKKIKALETEKEALVKDKMTEQEKADYELRKREKEIREREELLNKNAVELAATNALAAHEIPLKFKPFVLADSPENTEARVKELDLLWKQSVDEAVEKRLAAAGRIPPKGKGDTKSSGSMNDLIRSAVRR